MVAAQIVSENEDCYCCVRGLLYLSSLDCRPSLRRPSLLLYASVIARNVCSSLVFAASSRAASSHADLGVCTDGAADAQSHVADRTASCWHTRASVWIVMIFRPRPRMHEHANT
jgi:hypothetical protein